MNLDALALRLVPGTATNQPVGLHLTQASAVTLLHRIADRIGRYAGLRLALAGGEAVLFAPEPAPLPWCEAPLGWLSSEGPLLVPYGMRLDVPASWRGEVARRLLMRHGLQGPALVVPGNTPLRLLDLTGSRMLAEVDVERLGRMRG